MTSKLPSPDLAQFAVLASTITTTAIPATMMRFATNGYAAAKDIGRGAVYVRAAASGGPGAVQDSTGAWWQIDVIAPGYGPHWFGAKFDGVTDDWQAWQNCVNFAAGARINVPSGTTVIKSPVQCTSAASFGTPSSFSPGVRIYGMGEGTSIIDNQLQNGPLFYIDSNQHCFFVGSISGSVLTVTSVITGSLSVGSLLSGSGVTGGTLISSFGSGTGGVGTYNLNNSMTLISGFLYGSGSTFNASYGAHIEGLGIKTTLSAATKISFTGSITSNVLTVSAIVSGSLAAGQTIIASGAILGTLGSQLTGSAGSTGTYNISNTADLASQQFLAMSYVHHAIQVFNGYQCTLKNLYIAGMQGNGIWLVNGLFTDDGPNLTTIEQCWIEYSALWGVEANGTPGRNEDSALLMRQVFFQTNGTEMGVASTAAAPPVSGGMIWKGQVLTLQSVEWANGNLNVALYIAGQAGLGANVLLESCVWENTVRRSFYCTGVLQCYMRNMQMYNANAPYNATVGMEFDGTNFTVGQVDINGVLVRATSGNNPYTAFKISGGNTDLSSCRIRNVSWGNFDYTGQTRFNGWQFDYVPQTCAIEVFSTYFQLLPNFNGVAGSGGNITPLRLRGGLGGAPSTSGEWIALVQASTGITILATAAYIGTSTSSYLTGQSVAANTRYYAYLFDNSGNPYIYLDSANAPAKDATSGYIVSSNDASALYIGSVYGGAGVGTFATSDIGWLNPTPIAAGSNALPGYLWMDGSSRLRIKAAMPGFDTDGVVVGTQV